jgi:hypothetical protein
MSTAVENLQRVQDDFSSLYTDITLVRDNQKATVKVGPNFLKVPVIYHDFVREILKQQKLQRVMSKKNRSNPERGVYVFDISGESQGTYEKLLNLELTVPEILPRNKDVFETKQFVPGEENSKLPNNVVISIPRKRSYAQHYKISLDL